MKRVSDLLGSLMERKNIRSQVEAAQMVAAADEWINLTVPASRQGDVCAMSVRDGILMIACTSSASAEFVRDRAVDVMEYVCRKLPAAPIASVQTRLVSELLPHEF